jgi:hypothetical protein
MPAKTHLERWLERDGYSKTSADPLEYSKATITLTLSPFAVTAARTDTDVIPPAVLAALHPIAEAWIPVALW